MFKLSIYCVWFPFSWVQTNYPTYYSKFREHTDPAAAFVWEKLTIIGAFIAETTKPARDYLNVKIPQLLEKVRQIRCSVGASQHNPCYCLELRKKNVNQQIIELNYLVLDWRKYNQVIFFHHQSFI